MSENPNCAGVEGHKPGFSITQGLGANHSATSSPNIFLYISNMHYLVILSISNAMSDMHYTTDKISDL